MAYGFPVYVIHWRAPERLAATLQALQASSIPTSITILDNGGMDAKFEDQLSTSGAKIIPLPRNLGYAGAANIALALAVDRGERYIAITSHDCEPSPDALKKIVDALISRGGGAAGGRVWISGIPISPATFGVVDGREDVKCGGDRSRGSILSAEWVSGSLLCLDVGVAVDVGGFSPEFFCYVEEPDLCRRVRESGREVWYVEDADVFTRGSVTTSSASYYITRNVYWYERDPVRRRRHLVNAMKSVAITSVTMRLPWRSELQRSASRAHHRAVRQGVLDALLGRGGPWSQEG